MKVMLLTTKGLPVKGQNEIQKLRFIRLKNKTKSLPKFLLEPSFGLSGKLLGYTSCTFAQGIIRSSHQRCLCKDAVLRNFAKFTGKHLCQSFFFNKVVSLFIRFVKILSAKCGLYCGCSFCVFFSAHGLFLSLFLHRVHSNFKIICICRLI